MPRIRGAYEHQLAGTPERELDIGFIAQLQQETAGIGRELELRQGIAARACIAAGAQKIHAPAQQCGRQAEPGAGVTAGDQRRQRSRESGRRQRLGKTVRQLAAIGLAGGRSNAFRRIDNAHGKSLTCKKIRSRYPDDTGTQNDDLHSKAFSSGVLLD